MCNHNVWDDANSAIATVVGGAIVVIVTLVALLVWHLHDTARMAFENGYEERLMSNGLALWVKAGSSTNTIQETR